MLTNSVHTCRDPAQMERMPRDCGLSAEVEVEMVGNSGVSLQRRAIGTEQVNQFGESLECFWME